MASTKVFFLYSAVLIQFTVLKIHTDAISYQSPDKETVSRIPAMKELFSESINETERQAILGNNVFIIEIKCYPIDSVVNMNVNLKRNNCSK